MILETTPSQTVGPYFAIGLPWPDGPHAVGAGHARARSAIRGTLSTAPATPMPDYLLETWQADPDGHFADAYGYGGPSTLRGLPRLRAHAAHEDGDGTFEFVTVKPGPVPRPAAPTQAPHIDVSVFARGMLEPLRHPDLLRRRGRRPTPPTRCSRASRRTGETRCSRSRPTGGYALDIRLQGDGETVFFTI